MNNASVKILSAHRNKIFSDLDYIMSSFYTASSAAVRRREDGLWTATILLQGEHAKAEQKDIYEALGRRSMEYGKGGSMNVSGIRFKDEKKIVATV